MPASRGSSSTGTDKSADGYETLRGRAFGSLDPAAPQNAIITDLSLAPRNASGQVEYVTHVSRSRSRRTWSRASGVLWYELVNRGGPLRTFDSMARLWTRDAAQRLAGRYSRRRETNYTVQVPVARNRDGSPITGTVLARLADVPAGTASRPLAMLANAIPYDAASLDTPRRR
jgi:hypothetical protein